jgi:hypothetical protein
MRDNPGEMRSLAVPALVFAPLLAACGPASEMLYVGSALGEAGSLDAAGLPETGAPLDSSGAVDATDAADAAGPFDTVCTPAVDFQNLDPAGGGRVFTDNVKSPTDFVQTMTRKVCAILYRSVPEVPNIPRVTLIVQPLANVSPSITGSVTGNTATINSNFFVPYANSHTADDTLFELSGVTAHLLSFMYERGPAPAGVLSGVNDFVRYRLGFLRDTARKKGGNWDDGYQTTAFFFVYLDDAYPNFVYRLNLVNGTGYSVTAFQVFTGKDVATLWAEYQATL